MLYGRIPLVFFLCCIVCFFQRSCCELKTKMLTLMREGVPYKDVIECQDCILKVAGAIRATRYRKVLTHLKEPIYAEVQYSVTGSDFAFMGIHSKCAMLRVCGGFKVEDSKSPPDKPGDMIEWWKLNTLERTRKKEEAAERDPMCFTLEPMKATSQIRSCLKESSGSEVIREYSVVLLDSLIMRSIIILYPEDKNQKPEKIHSSCQHLDHAVDSSNYVPVAECRKLSFDTSYVAPTTFYVKSAPSTQVSAHDNIPTSSHDTKNPIEFSPKPRCVNFDINYCDTIANCMKTFFRGSKGVAVLLRIDGTTRYFYLYSGVETRTPRVKLDPDCNQYPVQHYDVSDSLMFQISTWQPLESVQVIYRGLPYSHRNCAVVYHKDKYADCKTCIRNLGDGTTTEKMTGTTILLSMTEDFDLKKLAPCIVNSDLPSGCSYYKLLTKKMCQYIQTYLPEDSDINHVGSYDGAVTLVNWMDLERDCLEDLALHRSVLLVSLERNYVYMQLGERPDPILEKCGKDYVRNNYYMENSNSPAISSQEMTNIIKQSLREDANRLSMMKK